MVRFADRPDDMSDVFHTLFGIAGLSLIGNSELKQVDPKYCMSKAITSTFNRIK